MYTAFPDTILDTVSDNPASTRFDSEPPLKMAVAYFAIEFVIIVFFFVVVVFASSLVVSFSICGFWKEYVRLVLR